MCPINCAGCCFQLCRDTSQQWQRKPCFCGTHWVSKSKSQHVWEEYGVYGVLFLRPYARKVVYTLNRGKHGLLGEGAVELLWWCRWPWRVAGEVLTPLGIPYCADFCKPTGLCLLPGKSHLWACWSRELLKLAPAGYCATGLAGGTPASTSDVNHSLATLPCAIQKYFVTLPVGSFFFNVILNLQKRETGERRLPIHVHLETHLQLQDTIHYCSDMRPAVINRQGSHAEHSRWRASARGDECQLLFLSKVLLKDQYYFLFHWPNLKNNCERAA